MDVTVVVTIFAGTRWTWLFWIASSRVRDGRGSCFVTIVVGMRWTWLFGLPFRGFAMDMVHVELWLQDLLVLQFAVRTFTFFSCSICAFALLLAMTMNGELVNFLQTYGAGAGRNGAFCERTQKLLE